MTSITAPQTSSYEPVESHPRIGAALSWLEAQSLFITALAAVAAFSLAKLPQHITQDSWLSLVGGRYVAAHGIPQHDHLFLITHGARWIDQQWLAQLVLYELSRLGGLALYGAAYVLLTIAGIGLAIAAGRALGASERHMLWVLPLAGGLYFAGSFNVRPQGFAYPLFSATLWLLAREVRRSGDRRIYLVFPLLILWGNLHGSVTLGVGLAMVCGAILLVKDLRAGRSRAGASRRVRVSGVLLVIVSPICLLVNPYGLAIVGYYRETILNPAFGQVVTEWQPITSIMLLAIPFFVIAFATVWVMGRSGRRMPVFDQVALVILCAGAVFAIRNISWYGLAVIILLPGTISVLSPTGPDAPRRTTINLSLAGLSMFVLAAATLAVAIRPASWFERTYDLRAAGAVERLVRQQPGTRIYADNRFADWLLWHDPRLAGRMAYDIRFEMLTTRQLQSIVDVAAIPRPREPSLLSGYRLLVLDPGNGATTERLLARRGTRVILRSHSVDVATWQPPS